MATEFSTPAVESLADLLGRLGGVSPARVVLKPLPGTATEEDLLRLHQETGRLYELVEGTLVEKVMGYGEGGLGMDIGYLLRKYLEQNDLGDVVGADATMRLMAGLVRLPDVSFTRWERLPNRERPAEPIPDLAPDLAVEVLSRRNTRGEMRVKLKEYFLAGTTLVWLVDPRKRTVEVFTAPDRGAVLTEEDTLDGGDLLPGLRLPVRDVFARVPRSPARPAKKPRAAKRRPRRGEKPA